MIYKISIEYGNITKIEEYKSSIGKIILSNIKIYGYYNFRSINKHVNDCLLELINDNKGLFYLIHPNEDNIYFNRKYMINNVNEIINLKE